MSTNGPVAIVGAGALGCCCALELASKGIEVHLYEKNEEAVSEASYINEGKIHLGFIYAKDQTFNTARKMIDGALQFSSILKRWTNFDTRKVLSTPFYYCQHKESQLTTNQLISHYEKCVDYCNHVTRSTGEKYLDLNAECSFRNIPSKEMPDYINSNEIESMHETTEYAIDPWKVALYLREAIHLHPKIVFRNNHEMVEIEPGKKIKIVVTHEEETKEFSYSKVANATWFRKLPFDRRFGLVPKRPWSHRYKFGNRILLKLQPEEIPSLTCVQGPFGDIVNFGSGGLFLSWYPEGCVGFSVQETPPNWDKELGDDQRKFVFDRSFDEWTKRCELLKNLKFNHEDVEAKGAVIYALGTEDIDIHRSNLHNRYEIGIQQVSNYYTCDTGKYTLAPLFGVKLAQVILSN